MKVVLISNFSDETIAESLYANAPTVAEAKCIADDWNAKNCHDYATYHAVVKDDDYRLWRGMADLV